MGCSVCASEHKDSFNGKIDCYRATNLNKCIALIRSKHISETYYLKIKYAIYYVSVLEDLYSQLIVILNCNQKHRSIPK